jgi:predicted GH43/DUF377 family glycosyl hydrolase
MKKNTLTLLLLLVILVLCESQVYAQGPWTKDANNPVLSGGGASGAWNRHVFCPHVLYNPDSTRYEMWFCATSEPFTDRPFRIGFATSPDGITWTMYPDPVLEPAEGTWDEYTVEDPMVIRQEDGQYKMWYASWGPESPGMIGYATSSDGINWTKDMLNNPVMVPGPDSWQVNGFSSPYVLSFEGGYKMWYTGWSANWDSTNIGYATSPDGISWTPDNIRNPVLMTGGDGRWDDSNLKFPNVLLIDNMYHMWYTGWSADWSSSNIGYATSPDGLTWTPDTLNNPILTPSSGKWDGLFVEQSAVILDTVMYEGDSLRMWYSGSRSPTLFYPVKIGHAIPLVNGIKGNYISFFPEEYSLAQNYPNPFNPSTKIEFTLPKSGFVKLEIFNTIGQRLKLLLNKHLPAGNHEIEFNAEDLASGIYLYRIESGEWKEVKKMILLK